MLGADRMIDGLHFVTLDHHAMDGPIRVAQIIILPHLGVFVIQGLFHLETEGTDDLTQGHLLINQGALVGAGA